MNITKYVSLILSDIKLKHKIFQYITMKSTLKKLQNKNLREDKSLELARFRNKLVKAWLKWAKKNQLHKLWVITLCINNHYCIYLGLDANFCKGFRCGLIPWYACRLECVVVSPQALRTNNCTFLYLHASYLLVHHIVRICNIFEAKERERALPSLNTSLQMDQPHYSTETCRKG